MIVLRWGRPAQSCAASETLILIKVSSSVDPARSARRYQQVPFPAGRADSETPQWLFLRMSNMSTHTFALPVYLTLFWLAWVVAAGKVGIEEGKWGPFAESSRSSNLVCAQLCAGWH